MSFKPSGISISHQFTNRNNNQRKNYSKDLLCEVKSYSIGASPETSSMRVVDLDDGRHYDISVDPDTISRVRSAATAPGREPAKWLGSHIDERMKNHVPPGSWVVLVRVDTKRTIKGQNGEPSLTVGVANYIKKVSDPSPEKAFRGIFTISSRDNRVNAVQSWDDQAFSLDNTAKLDELAARFDEVVKAHEESAAIRKEFPNKKTPVRPGVGVQFRTLIEDGVDKDGKPKFTVIDMTPPFEWMQAERDESGAIVKEGGPMTGEKFRELVAGYQEYLETNEAFSERFPSSDPRYKDIYVELMPYKTYIVSKMSRALALPASPLAPMNRLINTPTKYSMEDTDPVLEKNWAVNGIIVLSTDSSDSVTKTFIDQNFVQDLHVNAAMRNLHAFVKTAGGSAVEVLPELDRPPFENQANNTSSNPPASYGAAGSSAPSADTSSGLEAAADPFASGVDPFSLDDSEASPYEKALQGAPSAPEPAAAPAAEKAPASPPASPAPMGRRTRSVS